MISINVTDVSGVLCGLFAKLVLGHLLMPAPGRGYGSLDP